MSESKMMKVTVPIICPHCSKEALVSFRTYLPAIDWALKKEDLEVAKIKLKKGVEEITFNELEKKKEVLSWIEKDEFLISPDEVVPVLEQIKKDNTKEEEEEK